MKARADELAWLRWFWDVADFGPADSDVKESLMDEFMRDTGKRMPEGYDKREERE